MKDPERVVICNPATGKSVTGALFRRESRTLGRALQLSSDAAEAPAFSRGSRRPCRLLREGAEGAAPPPPPVPAPAPDGACGQGRGHQGAAETRRNGGNHRKAAAPGAIEQKPLDPVAKTAVEAIDKAVKGCRPAVAPAAAAPATGAPSAIPAQPAGALSKPYSIGIFSTEENAKKPRRRCRRRASPRR
ncbi:MAG: hypothetical protein R3D56_04090 [Paracoccaceae bacterium]